MAEIREKVAYKRFNGTTWETIYFTTTASSVIETTGKRFLNPGSHKVNGMSFFNESGVAQSITLGAADLKIATAGENYLEGITVDAALLALDGAIETLEEKVDGIINGGVVTGITTPTQTNVKGLVDLTSDFARYLPLTGGALTGAVSSTANFTTTGDVEAANLKGTSGELANLSVSGSATIKNLTVTGTTTTVNATNLEVSDNLITVANGNTVTLANPAGIVVPKYDGTNYGAFYFDSTGTAYVGDVALDGNGQIDITAAATTAKALVVRANESQLKDNEIAVWKYDAENNVYMASNSVVLNSSADQFAVDANVSTYGAMKAKVAGSIASENNVISLKAVDGNTVLGTVTLNNAANKDVDTAISYNTTSENLPTSSAVNTFVKSYSNRTFYADSEPTDARAGDLWFDSTGSVQLSQ